MPYLATVRDGCTGQLFEMGSPLQDLAREYSCSPRQLFGSLRNSAQRLLEGFRYRLLPNEAFDSLEAARGQIRLCDSS